MLKASKTIRQLAKQNGITFRANKKEGNLTMFFNKEKVGTTKPSLMAQSCINFTCMEEQLLYKSISDASDELKAAINTTLNEFKHIKDEEKFNGWFE